MNADTVEFKEGQLYIDSSSNIFMFRDKALKLFYSRYLPQTWYASICLTDILTINSRVLLKKMP